MAKLSANVNKKTDRRVIKTRKAIHNAFVELISARDISDITVKDIADLADINRKTFYNHYTDISQLVDEMENLIVKAFDEAMEGINIRKALRDPDEMCRRLLAIGHNCGDICAHLMKIHYDGEMVNKISKALKRSIIKSTDEQIAEDERKLDMLMGFVVAGALQTYQDWFNSDRTESIEEITRQVSEIVVYGINGVSPGDILAEREDWI